LATLVLRHLCDLERTGESLPRRRKIGCLKRDLAQEELALAFELGMVDGARNGKALLEILACASVVGDVQADLAQGTEADRFADPVPDLAEDGERFLDALSCPVGVALMQPHRAQHRERRRDVDGIADPAPKLEA